jgi:hypothetical protein
MDAFKLHVSVATIKLMGELCRREKIQWWNVFRRRSALRDRGIASGGEILLKQGRDGSMDIFQKDGRKGRADIFQKEERERRVYTERRGKSGHPAGGREEGMDFFHKKWRVNSLLKEGREGRIYMPRKEVRIDVLQKEGR